MKTGTRTVCFTFGLLLSAAGLAQDGNGFSTEIKQKAQQCMTCHGENGHSKNGQYPSLAGQKTTYLYTQLQNFMQGRRKDPVMTPQAQTIKDKEQAIKLAEYFSHFEPFDYSVKEDGGFQLDPDKVEKGRKIAKKNQCASCHGSGLTGSGSMPRISGQQPAYLEEELKAFRDGTRHASVMNSVIGDMTNKEIEALVHYITSL